MFIDFPSCSVVFQEFRWFSIIFPSSFRSYCDCLKCLMIFLAFRCKYLRTPMDNVHDWSFFMCVIRTVAFILGLFVLCSSILCWKTLSAKAHLFGWSARNAQEQAKTKKKKKAVVQCSGWGKFPTRSIIYMQQRKFTIQYFCFSDVICRFLPGMGLRFDIPLGEMVSSRWSHQPITCCMLQMLSAPFEILFIVYPAMA